MSGQKGRVAPYYTKRRHQGRADRGTSEPACVSVAERDERAPWGLRDVVVVTGLAILLFYLLRLLGGLSHLLGHPIHLRQDSGFREFVFSGWELLQLACVVFFSLHKYQINWRRLGFRGLPRNWQYFALAGFFGGFVTTTFYDGVTWQLHLGFLVPHSTVHPALFSESLLVASYSFLIGSLLAPFVEEVLFRGFVFQGLLGQRLLLKLPWGGFGTTIGPWSAALMSGALFAAFHLQVGLLIPFTIVGMIYVWVYRSSGSLWTAVLCHATWNSYALLRALLDASSR